MLLATAAGLASAASSEPATNAPAAPVVNHRVSTSPDEPVAVANASGVGITPATSRPGQPGPVRAPSLPLTRAATRQRVESISPTRWLMHYGDVGVHDRD